MLTLGVLGGMGPMATADLYMKIIENTPAVVDQEHIRTIIYSNPQIPSRIDAILQQKEDPGRELIRSAIYLEAIGVQIIVMPCNTAHYWYEQIQAAVNVEVLNMIDITAQYISEHSEYNPALLLATTATTQIQLYQKYFKRRQLTLSLPGQADQEIVMNAIHKVKAGNIEENPYLPSLKNILSQEEEKGVRGFIAGCTELPLLITALPSCHKIIDPTLLLAKAAVSKAISS